MDGEVKELLDDYCNMPNRNLLTAVEWDLDEYFNVRVFRQTHAARVGNLFVFADGRVETIGKSRSVDGETLALAVRYMAHRGDLQWMGNRKPHCVWMGK